MPYLTFIGPHAGAKYNVSGFASRGYWVFRRGSSLVVRWGAVVVVKHQTYTVRWRDHWQQKIYDCGSVAAAKQSLADRLRHFQRSSHGYKLMRRGVRIHPPVTGGRVSR